MQVTRLKLKNVRAIQEMEFHFRPDFNLVVGVNGVGKTTVLDALAACLSGIVNYASRLPGQRAARFANNDIRVGAEAMDIECDFTNGEATKPYCYTIRKPHTGSGNKARFVGYPPPSVSGNEPGGRPLAVLFLTNRAASTDSKPSKGAAAGGVAAAYAHALWGRRLRLREFEAWMRAQQALVAERRAAGRMLAAFEEAVTRFLPGYRNLRPGDKGTDGGFLLIDHGDATLPVNQLSDGERGVLAMVLDLTRRLAQANPEMANPVTDAGAVVLIDEIDLHVHPQWQRRIVENLTNTFPRCQFIATTHSPQVIGEVETERIHILDDGEVYPPPHSFGVDSSRVLEEIMDTPPRTRRVQELLKRISDEIAEDKFEQVRDSLGNLIELLGENDPEVTRIRTFLAFMEDGE